MNIENTKLSHIKANPGNPRVIKDGKFHKLVNSILALPKMLELRPIVTDAEMIVLGGNQRLRALEYIASMDDGELESRIRSISDVKKKSDSDITDLCLYWKQWKDVKTVPCVKADELTADEQRQFIIKDNANFGEWDWDMLANEFDNSELVDWGVDVWGDVKEELQSEISDSGKSDSGGKDVIYIDCKDGDVLNIGDIRLKAGDRIALDELKEILEQNKC